MPTTALGMAAMALHRDCIKNALLSPSDAQFNPMQYNAMQKD
jgi:hypothetical protein